MDNHFHCDKLKAEILPSTCVARRKNARIGKAGKNRNYIPEIVYSCMLTCYDCKQGREIEKEWNKTEATPESVEDVPKKVFKRKLKNHQRTDYKKLMLNWNWRFDKNFKSVKQWLLFLYKKHNYVIRHMAREIGISSSALVKEFQRQGIEKVPRIRIPPRKVRFKILMEEYNGKTGMKWNSVRSWLGSILKKNRKSKTATAKELGISVSTLNRRLSEFDGPVLPPPGSKMNTKLCKECGTYRSTIHGYCKSCYGKMQRKGVSVDAY